jgi:alkylation response protein AidB-like acyl-CoA dehydrogenase
MLSFELSEEQQMIRDSVGAFAREQIRPAARPADESGEIPVALIAQAWQLGLVQGPIPESLGGNGDTRLATTGAIIAEELAWGDLSIAAHVLAPRLLAFPVLEMGTEEQRQRYLKRFTGADFVAATAALMEPRWDFDPTAMTTVARRDGNSFVLDGAKCVVPLAAASDTILVWAASANYDRVDGYMVARETPGLSIGEREKNMGLKGLATFEVELKGCRLGPEARLGGEAGADFRRAMSQSRVAMAAMGVGVAHAAFDYARDYAKERKAFGVPIATKQAVAFMLADMAIEVDAARLLVWEAAWHLDRGEDAHKESYLARSYVAASALKVTDNAVQVLGGHGYIREHPVEMWLRNARGFSALEGLATV